MRGAGFVLSGTGSARAQSKLPGLVDGGVGEGWERGSCRCPVPTAHPLQPWTWETKRFLSLHSAVTGTWRGCCSPGKDPRWEIPAGRGAPGDTPGCGTAPGLTEACRCVLERIPWIFTWFRLAAAMSTHSPLRRASPGP